MPYIDEVLRLGGVQHEPFETEKVDGVFITRGLQVLGSYRALEKFRQAVDGYAGWHRHHVFEDQDWSRLHIEKLAPRYEDQLCVFLPERAHVGRINSILHSHAAQGFVLSPRALLRAYDTAYDDVGNYCGGGDSLIRRELVAIVRGTLRFCGQL